MWDGHGSESIYCCTQRNLVDYYVLLLSTITSFYKYVLNTCVIDNKPDIIMNAAGMPPTHIYTCTQTTAHNQQVISTPPPFVSIPSSCTCILEGAIYYLPRLWFVVWPCFRASTGMHGTQPRHWKTLNC